MKRFALKLVMFLLLGAILNVAVAWICVCKSLTWFGFESWRDGIASIGFRQSSISEIDYPPWVDKAFTMLDRRGLELASRQHAPSALPELVSFQSNREVVLAESGWPLLTISSRRYRSPVTFHVPLALGGIRNEVLADGIPITVYPQETRELLTGQVQLPLRPVWPGFAVNTIFYAAVLWLPFVGLGAFRRRRRTKRGLCPKCGYDLRGRASENKLCPECGATAPTPL